jgi:hypothetical protein
VQCIATLTKTDYRWSSISTFVTGPADIRAVAALSTVGLGAVAWVIALQRMNSLDTDGTRMGQTGRSTSRHGPGQQL